MYLVVLYIFIRWKGRVTIIVTITNVKDKDMMGNIRRTVDFIKSGNQAREAAKKFPKFTNRAIEEVSEDAIETTSIEHIQHILNEDVDLIFDALVIADYIEEEDNA